MKIKLSVCIPIYNFGHLIGETLGTIIPQLTDDVEIVVVDGASTDHTEEVMREYLAVEARLRYVRLGRKGGIDQDMASAVALSRGSYCWLFSGDDYMQEHALARVLAEIEMEPDLLLFRHWNCLYDMTPVNEHPVLQSSKDVAFDLSNEGERLKYFRNAVTSEAFFSFMSGLVFRKSLWEKLPLKAEFIGSCWSHAARFIELMAEGFLIKYIHHSYVLRRGDNDSFMDRGVVNRYRIAIEGYHRIAQYFFGARSEEAFHIRRVIRNELPLRYFIYAKYMTRKDPKIESIEVLNHIAKLHFSDFSIRNLSSYLTIRLLPALLCEWCYLSYRRWIRPA